METDKTIPSNIKEEVPVILPEDQSLVYDPVNVTKTITGIAILGTILVGGYFYNTDTNQPIPDPVSDVVIQDIADEPLEVLKVIPETPLECWREPDMTLNDVISQIAIQKRVACSNTEPCEDACYQSLVDFKGKLESELETLPSRVE